MPNGNKSNRFANKGRSRTYGADLRAKYYFTTHDYLYGNYSYAENYNLETENIVGDIPLHKGHLGVNTLFLSHLNVNLRGEYIGLRKTVNYYNRTNPLIVRTVPAYFVANSTLSYIDFVKKGVDLFVKLNNILVRSYWHPGVRSADGLSYSARIEQPGLIWFAGFSAKM